MELRDVTKELWEGSQRLSQGSKHIFELAKKKAEAEKQYRIALQKSIMRLKDEGRPATLIPDLARGEVAEEKYQRDLAEAEYTAGRESLEAIKSQLSALQTVARYQEEV